MTALTFTQHHFYKSHSKSSSRFKINRVQNTSTSVYGKAVQLAIMLTTRECVSKIFLVFVPTMQGNYA